MNELISKLCRAGLITHLVEVDRDTVQETDAAACVRDVLGSQVFRIAPYLYGVDLSSMVDATDEERVGTVTDALCAHLGPETVGLATLVLDPPEQVSDEDKVERNTHVLMQAVAAATHKTSDGSGIYESGWPDPNAVVSAEYAVRTAELTAKGLVELALPAPVPAGDERLLPLMEAATETLGTLELRLDHLECRIGEIMDATHQSMPSWADAAVLTPLRNVEDKLTTTGSAQSEMLDKWAAKLDARMDELEQGQIPAEWFLGRIMTRIAGLEEKMAAALNAVPADPMSDMTALADAFSERLEPLAQTLGRIDERLESLEQANASASAPLDAAISDMAAERKQTKKSIATLKAQVTVLNKKHDQIALETDTSLEAIRRAISDILKQDA